jgi:hypothetical protein
MTENDFDRTARLWLDDGPTRSPDRVLQSALDEIHVTRQRRSWWPARRIFDMNAMKAAIGGAVIVAAVALAIVILPAGSGGFAGFGGPAATPTPAPTPVPTPVPTPSPMPVALSSNGDESTAFSATTFSAGDPFPIPFTMDVPTGWHGNIGGQYAVFFSDVSSTGGVQLTLSQAMYADPCGAWVEAATQPGPAVADLVAALTSLPRIDVTTPIPVTIDGAQGQRLTLSLPSDGTACPTPSGATPSPPADGNDGYHIWQLPLGADLTLTPGQPVTLTIVDVGGERLVIASEPTSATSTEDVQRIVDSIRFHPTN